MPSARNASDHSGVADGARRLIGVDVILLKLIGSEICQHPAQRKAINQLNDCVAGEVTRLIGKCAGCHQEAARRALRSDHAVQLADDVDSNFGLLSMFALNEIDGVIFLQPKIDATVRAGRCVGRAIMLASKGFSEQTFKLPP